MPNTLLDNFSSGRNASTYFLTGPVSTPKISNNPKMVTPPKTKVKGSEKKELIEAVLGGLAVIGLSLVSVRYLQRTKIKKEIISLKQQVRASYLIEKNKKIQELYDEGLPKSFGSEVFRKKKVFSSKDIEDVRLYYQKAYNAMQQVQDESLATIRGTISKLSGDDEWKSLRKYRKILLKDLEHPDYNRREIAVKKIRLINDLLVYKIHPEEENIFNSRTLISVDDARNLLKKNFVTEQEFDADYQNLIKYEFQYNPMNNFFVNDSKLSLLDLFKSEITDYRDAENKKKYAKLILDSDIPSTQQRYMDKLKEAALLFRTSENVATLKALNSSKVLS